MNRVGDAWRDQTRMTGHYNRLDDLDLFASLGLSALRYPVLWECTETAPGAPDWRWSDQRMAHLRALGMRPIVGLIHHGSGPQWTGLLDPAFATGLARHAARVAQRYPWVADWTPVNEPLTTARFSALYGHWHPHRRDERAFWVALLNQIDATRLSMREIRAVHPGARLIQTEDFGRTYSTVPCESQARFENDRRLMSWDLLCGRVVAGHDLFDRIASLGLGDRLSVIADDPCPPDIIGVNHYVTSDRFLDHRLARYPPAYHGSNGEIAYADVEAVRAVPEVGAGWAERLTTLWERYGLPLAVTECHLGAQAVEQIRWFDECRRHVVKLAATGVDIRAITAWALLGSVDWDSLVTRQGGHYEAGAFDVSTGVPIETPFGTWLRRLGTVGAEPEVAGPGWWWRPDRRLFRPEEEDPVVSAAA